MLKFIKSVTTGPYNLIIGIFLGSILTMIAIEFKIFIFTNIGWIISGLSLLYILFYILINKELLKVEGSVVNGFQIYYDLIKVYIDNIISLWNDLTNLDVEDSMVQRVRDHIKHSSNQDIKDIKDVIKVEVKDALKEVITEALDQIHEDETSNITKYIILISGVLFLFIFKINRNGLKILNINYLIQSYIVKY
jgi:F0F1-type ATP synthase membrane subunit a